MTKQLEEALRLQEVERKNKAKDETNRRENDKREKESFQDYVENRMRDLEESMQGGKGFLSSTPHDKADVNRAITKEVESETAKAMDSFMKDYNNTTVQAVMKSLHTLNTDDPAFTPYPWKDQSESSLNTKITTTADKRLKDTVQGRQLSGREEEPSIYY